MDDRIRRTGLILAAFAIGATLVGAAVASRLQGTGPAQPVPTYWDAPAFELTDQTGATFTRAALDGTAWLASFVYTHCPDFCPLVTQRMARLRDDLGKDGQLGSRVRLVSFTVDPARDTPAVLRDYAARFGADDPAEWAFLTGPAEAVHSVVQGGFKLTVAAQGGGAAHAHGARADAGGARGGGALGAAHADGAHDGAYTVAHSDRIVLVDAAGRVRGFYAATDPAEMERLKNELRAVLRE